ncbi:MAG: hypothetical protein K2Q22_03685, partial [Cytophagales bacterium]|nr:hypothetical protein [Cytophagales bacterium]
VDFPLASHKVESGWEMTIYKVTVVKNGVNFPGFLPQKYLVVNNLKLNDDNTLLLTLIPSSVTKYSDVIGRYTVINQKNEVLDYKEIPLIFTPDFVEDKSDNFIFSQNMRLSRNNTLGINGVNTVINSEMSYPACGYDSGCIYLFWDGKLLYHVLSKVEMYEAGLFSNFSHVVFPHKSVSERTQDTIYYQQIHSEQDEDNGTSSYDSTVLAYYWTRDKQIIGPDTLFTYKK